VKRLITALLLPALAALFTLTARAADAPAQIRIGYQKGSVSMVLAKSHRLLEQRFPAMAIKWIDFLPARRCWKRLISAVSI